MKTKHQFSFLVILLGIGLLACQIDFEEEMESPQRSETYERTVIAVDGVSKLIAIGEVGDLPNVRLHTWDNMEMFRRFGTRKETLGIIGAVSIEPKGLDFDQSLNLEISLDGIASLSGSELFLYQFNEELFGYTLETTVYPSLSSNMVTVWGIVKSNDYLLLSNKADQIIK